MHKPKETLNIESKATTVGKFGYKISIPIELSQRTRETPENDFLN